MQIGEISIISEIGRGSFATVYKGKRNDGTIVAVKTVVRSKLNRKLSENLETEIDILTKVVHPHIVSLYKVESTANEIHLIMEYCSLGDLSMFIKRRDSNSPWGGLQENVIRCFLGQLASALEFLRSISVIHRDLKPQNILLSPGVDPVLPTLKLADFGFARPLAAQSMASTLCGSPLYMAPEILRGDRYNAKADLWSLGAILYELCTARPPFRAQNHVELLRKIEKGDGWIRFPGEALDERFQRDVGLHRQGSQPRRKTMGNYPSKAFIGSLGASPKFLERDLPPIPDDLKDVIRRLLKRVPSERISFEEFFVHPAVIQFRKFETKLASSPSVNVTKQVQDRPFDMYDANGALELPKDFIMPDIKPLFIPTSTQPPKPPPKPESNSASSSFGSFELNDDDEIIKETPKTEDGFVVVEDKTKENEYAISNETQKKMDESKHFILHEESTRKRILGSLRTSSILEKHVNKSPFQRYITMYKDLEFSSKVEPIEQLQPIILTVLRANNAFHLTSQVQPELHQPLYLFSLELYELALNLSKRLFEEMDPSISISYQQPYLVGLDILVNWTRKQFERCLEQAEKCIESSKGWHEIVYSVALELSRSGANLELKMNPRAHHLYLQSILLLEGFQSFTKDASVNKILHGLYQRVDALSRIKNNQ